MNDNCNAYAFKVQGMVIDINSRLRIPENNQLIRRRLNNDPENGEQLNARENLIRDIYNGFSISLGLKKPPAECKSILDFMRTLVNDNIELPKIDLSSFRNILKNEYAVYLITEVQNKIDTKKGGMRSSKKRSRRKSATKRIRPRRPRRRTSRK